MTLILGAGLSGLIAATQFPMAQLHEARDKSSIAHKALLRFRSDALSRLTGIPFRKVQVRKSLWSHGKHVKPSISLANSYSRKTNGQFLDRSVWNIEPVERFIAPEDLIEQMVASIGNRIAWNDPFTGRDIINNAVNEPIISTIPMSVLVDLLFCEEPHEEGGWVIPTDFSYKSIVVDRYRVHGADVHQTVYYPDADSAAYRASITGDMLIVERSGEMLGDGLDNVLESFGMDFGDISIIEESHHQRFGKIAPIDDAVRRQFIFTLTNRYNIYSMGRFAVWKNILLDDVVQDGAVIKRLIQQGTYGAALHNSKERA